MTRPVTIADIQRTLACRPRKERLVPILPGRVGPIPPGFGLTVARSSVALGKYGALLAPRPKCEEPPRSTVGLAKVAIDAMREAFVDALYRAPPLVVQSSPQEDPGAQGRTTTWTPPGGVIIVNGGSTGAVAAADALLLGVAMGLSPYVVLGLNAPINLGSAGAPTALFTFWAPGGRALVARRFRLNCSEPSAFSMLRFTVEVAGEQVLPLFNMQSDVWFMLNVAAKPGVSVVIKATCLRSTAAYILKPEIEGWTIPVSTVDDSFQAKTFGNDRRIPL